MVLVVELFLFILPIRTRVIKLLTLYFRRNPDSAQTLVINDANSVITSNFNRGVPTVVVVHGWLSNQNTNINPVIRDG